MTDKEKMDFLLEEMESASDGDLKTVVNTEPELSPEIAESLNIKGNGEPLPETGGNQATNDATGENDAPQGDAAHPGAGQGKSDEKIMFNFSEFIDAEIGSDMIAWVIPKLSKRISTRFNLGLEAKEMEFTPSEKKTIAKPLQKAFDEATVGTKNPWIALILVVVFMVAVKLWMAYMDKKDREEEQAAENAGKTLKAKTTPTGKKRGRKPGSKSAKLADLETPKGNKVSRPEIIEGQADIILQP